MAKYVLNAHPPAKVVLLIIACHALTASSSNKEPAQLTVYQGFTKNKMPACLVHSYAKNASMLIIVLVVKLQQFFTTISVLTNAQVLLFTHLQVKLVFFVPPIASIACHLSSVLIVDKVFH